MKKILEMLIVSLMPIYVFGQMIDNFDALPDSSYWGYEISENADTLLSYINVSYVADPVTEGSGAMQLDYSAHNSEAWGGYAKIAHMLGGGDSGDSSDTGDDTGIVFAGAFGGTIVDGNTYTFPTGSEGWGGFANEDTTLYPFSFPDGGEIAFTGATAGTDVDVYFRFEYQPYPDVEPSYNTAAVTVSGTAEASYSVDIPAQGANTFSSFLLYVTTPDAPVTLTDVTVTSGDTGIVFSGAFGGTIVDGNTYTFPTGSEGWGGFANEDTDLYPFSFPNGGEIAFTGATAGTDVDVYFRFEYQPYPDVEPSYNTAAVTVSGTAEVSYSVDIPAQGANTFSSFLLYVTTPDAPVTLTNVTVTEAGSALAQANDWDEDWMTILDTHPRDGEVWDWSGYDSISFSYYNSVPQTLEGRIHLRLNLSDYGDIADPANYTGLGEYYYSFHYILDNESGWNTVTMPLERNDSWDGGGFNLTGWAGDAGNGDLDKDAIAGFHLEFSISGGGDGDYSQGTIILDNFILTGTLNQLENPGFELTDATDDGFGWGNAAAEGASASVEEDATVAHGGSKYAKIFTTGDAQWAVHYTETPIDVSIGETWVLSAWIKDISNPVTEGCSAGLKFEVSDAAGNMIPYETMFTDVTDEWGLYSVELVIPDDMVTMKAVLVGQTWAGPPGDYAYDDVWLQNVGVLDVIPPAPVQNVSAVAANHYNLVTWSDNDGEEGETYNVYASTQPITDISSPAVDVVTTNVLEGTQAAVHYLYNPLEDEAVSYYYAVACKDASNNVGEPGASAGSVTNTALGIPTISLDVPMGFVADGEFSEWYDSGITPFFLGTADNSWGTPSFVGNVADDDDLSGQIWLAVDEDYLYIAADVIDDVYDGYQPGDGTGGWWENDVFELFIGFYDQRGPKHVGMMRGDEPDYKFFFLETHVVNDFNSQDTLGVNGDGNYYQEGFNPDWVVEAKLALDDIAFGDDLRLNAVNGMRIPIEPTFHDNDGGGWEGNLVGSPLNTDNAWQTPSVWSTTWIGDQSTPTEDEVALDISTNEGWNIVGLPVGVEDGSLSAVFPGGTGGTLYSYGETYVGVDALMPGNGYWLHFPEAGTTTITGTPISSLTLSLNAGWNLFSGISEGTNVSGISDPDGIIVSGTCYGFNETYVNASVLTPGHGYWVNASADGNITISGGGAAKTRSAFTDRTVKANKLSFNGNDLYFGVSIPEEEMLSYQLPPKPPEGAFDVRFADNMKVAENSGTIEIMNNTDKLTISCTINIDAGEHMKWVLTSNEGKEYDLNGSEGIVVNGDVTGFTLNKVQGVPLTFSVSQNYPNPFNPETSIRYEIPAENFVAISVYNIMGQKITDLVHEIRPAGYHHTTWNSTNMHGEPVASGVYIYTVTAGDYRAVKKMISLK